jgi:hypothetical protein
MRSLAASAGAVRQVASTVVTPTTVRMRRIMVVPRSIPLWVPR